MTSYKTTIGSHPETGETLSSLLRGIYDEFGNVDFESIRIHVDPDGEFFSDSTSIIVSCEDYEFEDKSTGVKSVLEGLGWEDP